MGIQLDHVLPATSILLQSCLLPLPTDRICRVNNGECDHSCRSSGEGAALCSCRKGYLLAGDETTCEGQLVSHQVMW